MKRYEPCNPNATAEARNLLDYLADLRGRGIVLGQHTQTMAQEELAYIRTVTGKEPALCGFELLAYSPNINYKDSSPECLTEVEENKHTLEKAYAWAERKGLITFTWHWFSPLYGADKAFYQKNTPFDARLALKDGTVERAAFINDMDAMAELLKSFCQMRVPVLWRPFHESEGNWFWWGNRGPETARALFRDMYERYTKVHELNNLIWVWNSPLPEGYVGDSYCDVISRDMYLPDHTHSDYKEAHDELVKITSADKLTALGENGPIPGLATLAKTRVPWTWFMTWSKGRCSEEATSHDELRFAYNSDYGITLDKLPALY
ncbi:MAG: glycoside hydrolase family 26 protein [Treponema sp.]|jgi:mannan endo-1,4-beta-mannosidase|nr:glycoside hydrolase family 26 protein [Treponema sp.]